MARYRWRRGEQQAAVAPADYEDYLASEEWARRRDTAIRRAGHRCQGCYSPLHLEVHHRTYDRVGDEDPGDLTVLCSPCHTAIHLVADARRGTVRSESRRARWGG